MAISTAAGALRLGASDPVERELTETVIDASNRMARLVSDLLDLSRLQAGAFHAQEDWCDVGDLVRAAVREATRERVSVVVDVPGTLPLVRGDARQLERVLVNLIENGAKFSPEGAAVEVRARPAEGVVAVQVLDRGRGVPASERTRIFEPFYRGTAGTGVPGSGLGLAIVRGLAEANHASVAFDARPGGGSAFTLSLPTSTAA
jgi:two-component system sensor histidine kinase KdpD